MTISLVAASHGTGVREAQVAITALVDAVREASPHLDVHEAFVDVQEPSLDAVVASVARPAVVVPLLLAPGFHVHVDVQDAVRAPGLVAAGTLGVDDRLVRLLLARLREAGATPDDVVVLAAAGSTDRRALRSIDTTAAMLAAAWGAPVAVGHLGGDGAPVGDVVREVSAGGRRVVAASYLMAPGFFHDRLHACGADAVTRPLLDGTSVDPGLVSIVLDRFAEAAGRLDWTAVPAVAGAARQM